MFYDDILINFSLLQGGKQESIKIGEIHQSTPFNLLQSFLENFRTCSFLSPVSENNTISIRLDCKNSTLDEQILALFCLLVLFLYFSSASYLVYQIIRLLASFSRYINSKFYQKKRNTDIIVVVKLHHPNLIAVELSFSDFEFLFFFVLTAKTKN